MIARTPFDAPPKIGLDSAGLLMTPEEFDAIEEYDDNYRYELIDGVLVVNPIPLEGESGPNELLGGLLFGYREYHEHGKSLDRTLQERFVRTTNSRRRADRVIWAGLGRRVDPKVDPPTIAVEFVSRSRRDRKRDYEDKREEYSANRNERVLDHRPLPALHDRLQIRWPTLQTNDRHRTGNVFHSLAARICFAAGANPGRSGLLGKAKVELLSSLDAWPDEQG